MNVICGRCETEYEFDDALVSERGTTVKCTNCGFQFRVQRARGDQGQPEQWLVQRASGAELVFTSLGELQRAIAAHDVLLEDRLSKDGQDYREMRDVAELVPFFHKAARAGASAAPKPHPETTRSPHIGAAPSTAPSLAGLKPHEAPRKRSEPPPNVSRTPLGGLGPAENPVSIQVPPSARVPKFAGVADLEPAAPTRRAEVSSAETTAAPNVTPVPQVVMSPEPEQRSGRERVEEVMDTQLSRTAASKPNGSEPPPSSRQGRKSVIPAPIVAPPPRRRASGMRWVIAIVLLGGVALVASTVGKGYLRQFVSAEPRTNPEDARVNGLLAAGEQHLVSGDLEAAKAEFDKASVLAENHAGALLGLARIEAVRADRIWQKHYLLADDAEAAKKAAKKELSARVVKLGAALSAARKVAPEDPRTIQLEIDYQRVQYQPEAARSLISRLTTDATDPDTAYVLAALDVAEDSPAWSTVLQRLRSAMATDRGLGRAQTLLIVALAKSGDIAAAERELEKLQTLVSLHSLSELLSAFVKRTGAEGATAAASASLALRKKDEPANSRSAFRGALEAAAAARRAGHLVQSEDLFERALQLEPGNVEATAGLGDLARRRGQLRKARAYFQTALSRNPDFIPAVVGLADLKWADGARSSAVSLYQRVAPGTVYYEHAQRRIRRVQASALNDPPAVRVEKPKSELPSPPGSARVPEQKAPVAREPEDRPGVPKIKNSDPYIDTTDLPE